MFWTARVVVLSLSSTAFFFFFQKTCTELVTEHLFEIVFVFLNYPQEGHTAHCFGSQEERHLKLSEGVSWIYSICAVHKIETVKTKKTTLKQRGEAWIWCHAAAPTSRSRFRVWQFLKVESSALRNNLVIYMWRGKLVYSIISLEMTNLYIFVQWLLQKIDLEALEIKFLPQNPEPALGPNDKHRSTLHLWRDT